MSAEGFKILAAEFIDVYKRLKQRGVNKMICVSCPIKQDFIIEQLEKYEGEDCQFKFVEKRGLK